MRPLSWGRSARYSQAKENEEEALLESQPQNSSNIWRLFWCPVPWMSLTVILCFLVAGLLYDARLRRYGPIKTGYDTEFGEFLRVFSLLILII